ncbi:hypothetical protein EM595_p0194 (plasmid) [Duffyella gerundensis]|uniref:Uncharacterized protein n=1 Tax=Duffyella gerundensis TaxID=1619313 RepID=A0A0U5LAX6_9GAMM|nr:hypothetical protein EM595_p0194 [Duffyella gerundensis]
MAYNAVIMLSAKSVIKSQPVQARPLLRGANNPATILPTGRINMFTVAFMPVFHF